MNKSKNLNRENIKKFFSDAADNPAYLIPVLFFAGTSVMHLFSSASSEIKYLAFIMQGIFIFWAFIISFRRKLVIWPVFIFGILLILAGTGMSLLEEYDMKKATEAYAVNDNIKARGLLESIDSDEIVKSKQYIQLEQNVNAQIDQETKILVRKARSEIYKNQIDEAKKTVEQILEHDSDNDDAAAFLEIIKAKDIITGEKQLPAETAVKFKALKKTVKLLVSQKKFIDARKSINQFLSGTDELKRDSLIIADISEKIDDSEKSAKLVKQKQLNVEKLNESRKLYKEKKYKQSAKLAKDILSIDKNNRSAKSLLGKAKARLSKKNSSFMLRVKAAGSFIFFVFFVWLMTRIITRCPGCGKHAARRAISDYESGRSGGSRWGTVQDTVTLHGSEGTQYGTVSRSVEIPTWNITTRTDYICRYCSHKWSVSSARKVDQ